MAKRRRKALGSPTKHHAKQAAALSSHAVSDARLALKGSCGIRFTSLESAISSLGKAWEHAFNSGGKTAKGALSNKTVSDDEAVQIYDAGKKVGEAVTRFRRDCVKSGDGDSLSGTKRRRRRR